MGANRVPEPAGAYGGKVVKSYVVSFFVDLTPGTDGCCISRSQPGNGY